MFRYFTSVQIAGYEVKQGTLSISNIYTGMAIRDEEIITSPYSGYVNYYAREGERVGFGNLIYTIDESGKLSDIINAQDTGENTLSEQDLQELKTEIISFSNGFTEKNFRDTYDFKYSVEGTVLKLANISVMENIEELSSSGESSLINMCKAEEAGVVVYNVDGYETLTPESITKEMFDQTQYTKTQLVNNALISLGDPVCKLSTDENWSLVIPLDAERVTELSEETFVKIRFLKNQDISWAAIAILQNADGSYAKLDFNNSMPTFCSDRFVEIELMTDKEMGLKIPNSSVVEKEFFLIPKEYLTKGGNSNESGFLKESYTKEGTATTEFIPVSLYNETETDYYVDNAVLKIGDYLIKPESTEKYPISKKATLIGVYNVNKGYADFKQVNILYQNEEYSIVESNTQYGLNVYDHIVLDATAVNENDFIYN